MTPATICRADALSLPLADNTVDLVVTSPPYFGLRSYQDGGQHYQGQLGSEATPAEFVDALLTVTAECMRVLKPCGSLWVNLGDSYAGSGQPYRGSPSTGSAITFKDASGTNTNQARNGAIAGIRPKSLIGIPWRYALACIDDLGLILRAEIIWAKPNGLPESVTDRVRRSHEQWFHFTLQPRYYSAVDEVREIYLAAPAKAQKSKFGDQSRNPGIALDHDLDHNPLGNLPGSVWTIPTDPLTVPDHLGVDHFAAFPLEWPLRIIRGWSPAGVCVACGEGQRPVAEAGYEVTTAQISADSKRLDPAQGNNFADRRWDRALRTTTITGYACACPTPDAPTTPARVLDPFGGTGTTALAAKALGRHSISIDLSQDYCRLAQWRTTDPRELAKAMRVDKPPVQVDGQLGMFDQDGVA